LFESLKLVLGYILLSITAKAIVLQIVVCALRSSFFKIFFSKVFEYTQLFFELIENREITEKTFFTFKEFLDNVKFTKTSFLKEFSVFAFRIKIFIDFFRKKVWLRERFKIEKDWIRTNVGITNRFTVCRLRPLSHFLFIKAETRRYMFMFS
tara:strand:+ start:1659 stop:2114 length:456 start_codon:yes stop_codon:yes gene_type:complete